MTAEMLDYACTLARARIASAIQTAALRHSIQIALDFERAHQRAHEGLPTLAMQPPNRAKER